MAIDEIMVPMRIFRLVFGPGASKSASRIETLPDDALI